MIILKIKERGYIMNNFFEEIKSYLKTFFERPKSDLLIFAYLISILNSFKEFDIHILFNVFIGIGMLIVFIKFLSVAKEYSILIKDFLILIIFINLSFTVASSIVNISGRILEIIGSI